MYGHTGQDGAEQLRRGAMAIAWKSIAATYQATALSGILGASGAFLELVTALRKN